MKVAVVGLHPELHKLAPWDDPEWEKWGLPWDKGYWPKYSRLFEMHDISLARTRWTDYVGFLSEVGVPLYMQEAYPEVHGAKRYPVEAVSESIHGDYFNSSIAYIVALAIHEGADEIGIYGVDMAAIDEFDYQRPNLEYLIGVARGKGIKVHIPEESSICKFRGEGITFLDTYPTYKDRYGNL